MSNRYAVGLGHGFCFPNAKQRGWFLTMFNGKIEPLVKRFEKFPRRTATDIVGDNLGIMDYTTRKKIATAIKLRHARTHEQDIVEGNWLRECYAELARFEGNIINVALVDREWYVSSSFMPYDVYGFVTTILFSRALGRDDVLDEDKLRDTLVEALIASGMNDDFVQAMERRLEGVDAQGIRTLADFEIAMNDTSI